MHDIQELFRANDGEQKDTVCMLQELKSVREN